MLIRITRDGRRLSQLLALVTVCVGVMVYAGCGGAKENETIIPEEPPAEKAKDSMDYYRNQMQKK